MYNYNPNDTTITVNGVFITGLGEEMISFEFDEDQFEAVTGAQGDVVVNESNDKRATMTLTVQASSPQNSMLRDYAKKGTVFPIWGVNKSIGERFGGTKARIKKSAPITYGKSLEDRAYEIAVFDGVVENA